MTNDEAMLRQSYPLYDAFCRENEDTFDAEEAYNHECDLADDAWSEKGLE